MKKTAVLFAAAWAAGVGGVASADTINATITGVRYAHSNYDNSQVQITLAGSSFTNAWVIAGPEMWTRNSGSSSLGNAFDTFCIEITQHVGLGSSYGFDLDTVQNAPTPGDLVAGAMGTVKADYIRELWSRHYGDVTSNTTAVAFQTAVWEIVYENTGTKFNVSSGDFKALASNAGASTLTTAQSWLNDITNASLPDVSPAGLVSLKSSLYQDQIALGPPSQGQTPTPLPTASCAGLVILGLMGAGGRRRRRGRSA